MCKKNIRLADLLSSPERGAADFRALQVEPTYISADGWRELFSTGTDGRGRFCVVEVRGAVEELADPVETSELLAELLDAAWSGAMELADGGDGDGVDEVEAASAARPRRTLREELRARGVPDVLADRFVALVEQDGPLLEDEIDGACDAAACAWMAAVSVADDWCAAVRGVVEGLRVTDRRADVGEVVS